jgi:hypothetical protein
VCAPAERFISPQAPLCVVTPLKTDLSQASLPDSEALELGVAQPRKKRLTFGDIPGALDVVRACCLLLCAAFWG